MRQRRGRRAGWGAAVRSAASGGRDDLLDITSEETESGKLPGTDLREGVATLPVLLALQADGPDSELARFVTDPTDCNVDRALKLLRGHPALELARDAARVHAAKAKLALGGLASPPALTPALDGLIHLAEHAATRVV